MHTGNLVRKLYEAYQARDWSAAEALLHPEVVVDMPATEERLVGREQLMRFNRDYPEPWGQMGVLRVVAGHADDAAAEVEVHAGAEVLRMASFWASRDGLLCHGTEYWLRLGEEPPPERASYRTHAS